MAGDFISMGDSELNCEAVRWTALD